MEQSFQFFKPNGKCSNGWRHNTARHLRQKRTLLEAFIATTGYVSKYARWLLNHAEEMQTGMGAHICAAMDRTSNTRSSWSGTLPTASAPNGSSPFSLP